jgi:hypothetical protein
MERREKEGEALSGAIHDSLGEHHRAELGKLVGD